MKQLKPIKNDQGELAVRCPRCDEVIVPLDNPIGLDGSDCPECDQVIEQGALSAYRRALRRSQESDE